MPADMHSSRPVACRLVLLWRALFGPGPGATETVGLPCDLQKRIAHWLLLETSVIKILKNTLPRISKYFQENTRKKPEAINIRPGQIHLK